MPFLNVFGKIPEDARALVLANSNCLCLYLLHVLTPKPAEEAGIGDTPNLEDQAAGHVTQGQWARITNHDLGVGRREMAMLREVLPYKENLYPGPKSLGLSF